ncbi:MAG: GntR family transcriptional regulator [Opitutaceae bacterium]|nr:GntR family transcriptional regulator [Opitutaceae bacterium]
MSGIPQRQYLSTQAAAYLREGILQRTWREHLPSERRLCELLRVSRPTVRAALHLIAKEGLIEVSQGRRNRIITAGARRQPAAPRRLVVIITHLPLTGLRTDTYHSVSELRAHLATHGFATEYLVCQGRSVTEQRRQLSTFLRQNPVFCCVLLSLRRELQQWFATQSIPALVLGSCPPEIPLPSLDTDYRAAGRHAAGILLGKGHRRLAAITTDVNAGGDLTSEEGFVAGVTEGPHAREARVTVLRHGGPTARLYKQLDQLFVPADAPTAVFVVREDLAFIVLNYLLQRGLSVPDKVSFISRDPNPVFAQLLPPLAHYTFEAGAYNHRLSRLMLQLVTHGSLPPEPNLIFPDFYPGGSVAKRDA